VILRHQETWNHAFSGQKKSAGSRGTPNITGTSCSGPQDGWSVYWMWGLTRRIEFVRKLRNWLQGKIMAEIRQKNPNHKRSPFSMRAMTRPQAQTQRALTKLCRRSRQRGPRCGGLDRRFDSTTISTRAGARDSYRRLFAAQGRKRFVRPDRI